MCSWKHGLDSACNDYYGKDEEDEEEDADGAEEEEDKDEEEDAEDEDNGSCLSVSSMSETQVPSSRLATYQCEVGQFSLETKHQNICKDYHILQARSEDTLWGWK